jgi:uncharacterized protein YcfJ
MKKSLLSALGLAVALAFSMPALGNAAATTTPAASTTTAAPMKAAPKKVAAKMTAKKVCKVTATHKCPVKHTAKKTAPKA